LDSRRIAPHLNGKIRLLLPAVFIMAMVATSSKPRMVPAFVTPMAAQSVAELPESDDWIYELKLDGSPYFWWCY